MTALILPAEIFSCNTLASMPLIFDALPSEMYVGKDGRAHSVLLDFVFGAGEVGMIAW
ncbi:MAG: hypothetical protein AAB382_10925 [Chloroflexota bacterium]